MQLLSQAITSKEASARPNGNSGLYGLFTRASAERLSDIVSDALGKGANILIGRHSRDSNVLQPVIIGDVTDDMRISREELFGPVLAVRTFQSLQEAADMANSVEYGLAAAIFGVRHFNPSLIAQRWLRCALNRFRMTRGSATRSLVRLNQVKFILMDQLSWIIKRFRMAV